MTPSETVVDGMEDEDSQISKSETEVYDRQIRLWGIEAQNKLRHSHVLIVGLRGLGAEVAKNLVLCGLNSMQIVDPEPTTEEDTLSNFFLQKDSIGKPRGTATLPGLQALNPLVKIDCAQSIDQVDLSSFTLVVYSDQSYDVVKEANEKCRSLGIRFISCSIFGWIGYSFVDFNNHSFLVRKEKPVTVMDLEGTTAVDDTDKATLVEDEEDQFETKSLEYPSFADALNVDWQTKKLIRKSRGLLPSSYFPLRALIRLSSEGGMAGDEEKDIEKVKEQWRKELEIVGHGEEGQSIGLDKAEYVMGGQLSAVCAVVGGFVGQESIKALTGGKNPLRNLLIYSALDSSARVCNFPPK